MILTSTRALGTLRSTIRLCGSISGVSATTVGVAETSPFAVNTHFGLRPLRFAGLMECSAGWLPVLLRFCPAIRHWPDRDSDERRCALTATPNKRVLINAAVASNALRFFIGICVVPLDSVAIGLAPFPLIHCTGLTALVLPKSLELGNSSFSSIEEQTWPLASASRNRPQIDAARSSRGCCRNFR